MSFVDRNGFINNQDLVYRMVACVLATLFAHGFGYSVALMYASAAIVWFFVSFVHMLHANFLDAFFAYVVEIFEGLHSP